MIAVSTDSCSRRHLATMFFFFDCGCNKSVLSSTCHFFDLICDAYQILVGSSIKKWFEANRFLWGISLDVFLLIIDMLKLTHKLGSRGLAKTLLPFLSTHDDEALLFKLHIFLFVLMCFCLAIQEFHEGHMINDSIRIVNQDELLLTIIKYLVCPLSWYMHHEEVWWFTFPRGRVLWILGHINLLDILSLFKFFSPFDSSSLRIIFIRIILFYHGRTIVLLLYWYIGGLGCCCTSFQENWFLLLEGRVNSTSSWSGAIRIFRNILALAHVEACSGLFDLLGDSFCLLLLLLFALVFSNLLCLFLLLLLFFLLSNLLFGLGFAPNFRGLLIFIWGASAFSKHWACIEIWPLFFFGISSLPTSSILVAFFCFPPICFFGSVSRIRIY